MRDTAIGILVVLGLIGAYRYLGQRGFFGNQSLQSSPVAASRADSSRSHSNRKRVAKGANHDSRAYHSDVAQMESERKGEGAAGAPSETESLTSIYPVERQRPVSPSGSPDGKTADSGIAEAEAAAPKTDEKVVYGVPLKAWLLSHRNQLPTGELTDNTGQGMRVFLQCMELKKKGPQSLSERGCEKLLSGSNPTKIEHATHPHPWFPVAVGGS